MQTKITQLIEKIETLNKKLAVEYSNAAKKYGFLINQKRINFLESIRKKNKSLKIPAWKYVFPKNIRHLLSMPFIYGMFIPVLFLDFFITIYNFVALPLYGIPKVKRKEFIVYDRQFLDYLNIIQKFNCVYCTYMNGFIAYAQEIAGQTERYWCPVKAARKLDHHHSLYKDFADYGNPEEWNKKFNNLKK